MVGWKIPPETPAPVYVPPSGIPPLSLNGWAVVVVMESKQRAKVTTGNEEIFIVIVLLVAGFPVGQETLDVNMQVTMSPFKGVY